MFLTAALRLFIRLSVVAFLVMFVALDPAAAERRVALVVANAAYDDAPLHNPTVDVEILRPVLQTLGFEVTIISNADLEAFARGLDDFYNDAKGADIALFYFAGHGFALENENYLMSTSAKVTSELDAVIRGGGILLDEIISSITDEARISLIFVDACRNDPRVTRGRSRGRGLVRLPDAGPEPLFVGLSTRLGEVAEDGEPGEGSPFVRAFARFMPVPGSRLDDAFTLIRLAVGEETKGTQRPTSRDDLDGPLTLLSDGDAPSSPAGDDLPDTTAPPNPPQQQELEPESRWGAIAYEDYRVSPGNMFGFSEGAPTRDDAIRESIGECERTSEWKGSYFWYGCTAANRGVEEYEPVIGRGCLSLFSNGNGIWRYARADDERAADRHARLGCIAANTSQNLYPCEKVRSFCVGD